MLADSLDLGNVVIALGESAGQSGKAQGEHRQSRRRPHCGGRCDAMLNERFPDFPGKRNELWKLVEIGVSNCCVTTPMIKTNETGDGN